MLKVNGVLFVGITSALFYLFNGAITVKQIVAENGNFVYSNSYLTVA